MKSQASSGDGEEQISNLILVQNFPKAQEMGRDGMGRASRGEKGGG